MTRRCKPGQRARIIGMRGANAGKVVVVVRHYFGELVNNATWPENTFPWVCTSLSGLLESVHIPSGLPARPASTVVIDDSYLEPLLDDDEDVHETEGVDLVRSSS